MTVGPEKLLRMAAQIYANMAYTDDKTIVAERVCDHLKRFWDPRMLAQIKTHLDAHPEAFSPELSAVVGALDE